MDKIREIYSKYKEGLAYLFFGGCTVLVNLVSYYLCAHIVRFNTVISTIIAWFIAVIFAYITNKLWVFESKSWNKTIILGEMLSFFTCRVITGLLDVVIMILFVDKLHFFDMLIKVISNILVIVLNYIASKWLVFKKK